jgi:hypothetical protein
VPFTYVLARQVHLGLRDQRDADLALDRESTGNGPQGITNALYNTPQNLDQGLRWIRCLNGKSIQETNDGEQA